MCRVVLVIALLASGCGDGRAPASGEASSGAEQGHAGSKPPPLPAPFEATFTAQVRVSLRGIAALVDAQLPTHEAQGLQQLTREGKSPALEASYDIWRDPVTLRYARGALRSDVPVRYAARFNARVKSPFGGWLTVAKNEPWGTEAAPQRVTLRVHTEVEVTEHWELRLSSRVDPPEHGPAPDGDMCTGGSFKLCIPKASVAPEVHRRIDAEIMPRMQQALADADRRLQEMVALRSRLEQAWQALAQPRRFDDYDRWAVIEPRQAALGWRADGDAIIIEPYVSARVSYYEAKPPAVVAPPLPDKSLLSALPGKRMPLPAELTPPQLQLLLKLLSAS